MRFLERVTKRSAVRAGGEGQSIGSSTQMHAIMSLPLASSSVPRQCCYLTVTRRLSKYSQIEIHRMNTEISSRRIQTFSKIIFSFFQCFSLPFLSILPFYPLQVCLFFITLLLPSRLQYKLITVATRTLGSWVCAFILFVVLCIGRGLVTDWSPVRLCRGLRYLKKRPRHSKGLQSHRQIYR